MENKNVGWMIVGIGVVIVIMVLVLSSTLRNLAASGCGCVGECSMNESARAQTAISLAISGLIIVIGIFFIFVKPKEKIIVRKVKERKKKLDLSKLDKDEKRVVDFLLKENKAVFQADLMEKLEIGKVKTTRLLDKLEAKQLIERKRRGMNNIVVLMD